MKEPTSDDLMALFDELRARRSSNGNADPDGEWQPPTPLVDWVEAYGGRDDDPAQWLAEPLLPAGGSVAIFAKGGTGKSLLALWLAALLATRPEPVEVLYLDYEMTLDTVVERLEDMGYAEPEQLAHLHYASLPSLAPLDTAEGGRAVVEMAKRLGARLVVIDTFGRAVDGEEDKADTVRAWYRWTGQLLKVAGVGFLRIDHAGKKLEHGQRGSSAKNDDVDVVWEMTERGHGEFLLRATKRRVSWVAERVVVRQSIDDGVLDYHFDGDRTSFLAGAKDVAELLDELDVPLDCSRRRAMKILRGEGHGRANNVVADALRYRRHGVSTGVAYQSVAGSQAVSGPVSGTNAKPQQDHARFQSVPVGEPHTDHTPTYVVGVVSGASIPGLFDDVEES